MAKRISDLDRIVNFFVNGTTEEIAAASATISAVMKAKNPPAPATNKKKGGRPRKSPAAGPSQSTLPTDGN